MKRISDGENNLKNKCHKGINYRNVWPNHQNDTMGSSTTHLNGVDNAKLKIDYKNLFLYYKKRINMWLFSVVTLECSFTRLDERNL